MQKQFLDNTGLTELLDELGQYLKEQKADKSDLNNKQDKLISGTNIKTINNESLLGSGDVELTASDIEVANGDTVQDSLDSLTNSKQNALISGANIKTVNNNSILGSGNIVLDGQNLDYTGEERYHLHASDTIDQSLDNLDTAIHDLDSIVGEEILTPTIVEHSYIIRDPAASRGNLATSNPWRVEVFKGLSEGENLLVTYSGTGTSSSAQVAGWYTDGDNLINTNYSYISNLNGYAQNIVGKTYLITVPNSTVKALALSLYTTFQAEVKRIGRIQAEIHGIENPNGIESITTTESSASGGNNTVTITETNGTTTTFNVKNGTDGVSLGEIALVQTTGDATDEVMSQKAVTEYGRKVTAEDLAGTSDWIKAKLTDEGWEFGKYINSAGNLANSTDYCASHYIPISNVEGKSLAIYGGEFTNGNICIVCYDANKTKIAYWSYTTKPRTFTVGTYSSTIAYIRMTCKTDNIGNCYILNSITGEYIFKAEEYFTSIFKQNNLVVDANFLEDTIIKQELGESTIKIMSQKAITDAIWYDISTEHGEGFTVNSNYNYRYIKLTPKAVSLLNASDKMTFMFSTRATGGYTDYRYFRFGNGSTTTNQVDSTNGVYVGWSYNRNLSANGVDYTLNKTGNNYVTPDIWVVTWDRINGVVKFYDHATLVNTLTSDSYKKDRFVNDEGLLAFVGGDNNARIYDIRLFDYDISFLFGYADVSTEINCLCGAGILPALFLNNYQMANNDSSFKSSVLSFSGGGYNTCTYTLEDDGYHIVVKDSTTTSQVCGGKPYYLGRDSRAQIEKLEFQVVSGVIKHCWRTNQLNENLNYHLILDSNGEEIADYDNIGVGNYTLIKTQGAVGSRFDFYKVSGDVELILNKTQQYKPISCVFHLRGDTMYNKKFYDDQTNSFITIYTDRTCTTEYTTHTMVKTPQRIIRNNISTSDGLPHYPGEMAVVGNNVYIGLANYTWKQINNS